MCEKQFFLWIFCGIVFNLIYCGSSQLVINVKNQGGDVVQESIVANVSENTVTLEFQRSDGTLITQLIDFTNDVQILRALVLGEEERGQSQYQVMCFVCQFQKNEFISSDAMSKLRQKNPGAVRTSEEDRGRQNITMDYFVDISRSAVISRHIAPLCSEAMDATYTNRKDLLLWAKRPGASESTLMLSVRPFPSSRSNNIPKLANEVLQNDIIETIPSTTHQAPTCKSTVGIKEACTCNFQMSIGWYPCGLKYCKGKNDIKNPAMSYRCGIKTCRRSFHFSYYVRKKHLCLWDE